MELGDLPKGHNYEVRVTAIDHNRGTVFTSPTVSVQTSSQCSAPRRGPQNVAVTPLGPTKIRLSWQPLPESEWNCDRLWYVVKYSSPESQGFRNLSNGESEAIFDSKPHTQWQFEVQAANPSAATQWSRPANTQTLSTAPGPVGDLIVYPLSAESVQLSWRQPQNPNGQISGYEITYQLISKGMCDNTPEQPVTLTSAQPITAHDRFANVPRIQEQVKTTRVSLRNLIPNTRYKVKVRAYTNRGAGPWSQDVTFDTRGSQPPVGTPPPARVVNTGPTEAHVVWQTNPQNANYYDKFRCQYRQQNEQQFQERQFPAYSPCQQEVIRRQQLPPSTP
uniref:Fibronectin type-III domain-containing protein n=1 Tax=Panagrolaimus sp. PS1159 TaxID=55785 RepID=A0AC35GRM0_9BILA